MARHNNTYIMCLIVLCTVRYGDIVHQVNNLFNIHASINEIIVKLFLQEPNNLE